MSNRITKAKRRYRYEFLAAMALYVVILLGALIMAKSVEPGPLLTALSLAPVAPILLAAAAFLRFYRNMDEMQQRLSVNAAALTLVLAIFAAITLGFLKRFGVMDLEDDMMWFGPVLIGTWGAIHCSMGGRDC